MEKERRCWAQIDLDKLKNNFNLIKNRCNNAAIMAVVKADAYGHGDVQVAQVFVECGAAFLAVSGFEEAMRLRNAGIKAPILILGYSSPANAKALGEQNITQTILSLEYARELSCAAVANNVCVNTHIKLDTGMGRIGFDARSEFDKSADEIVQMFDLPSLNISGLFTHFAVADSDSDSDIAYTESQHKLLCSMYTELARRGHTIELVHCCNSAGIAAFAPFAHELVRPGIILYGENPSHEVNMAGLMPAMALKAVVAQVKTLDSGRDVSYGRAYTTEKPTRIATLTIGYADGYPRALSNKGIVSIHGNKCKVIGKVCMDQMMVDISDIENVHAGDVATIFGDDGADSVENIADKANTIVYEILCGISRRVPRVYISCGREVGAVDYLNN